MYSGAVANILLCLGQVTWVMREGNSEARRDKRGGEKTRVFKQLSIIRPGGDWN